MSRTYSPTLAVDLDTVAQAKFSPFRIGASCFISVPAAAAATLYFADHPGTGDATRYQEFKAGAATTVLTLSDDMNVPDIALEIGDIDETNRLQVIVLVNGSPLLWVGSDDTPSAGEFMITDTSEITLGEAPDPGAKIEVFSFVAGDIDDTGVLAAGSLTAHTCHSFYTSDAPATLISAERG